METAMINAMCRCCASEGAFKDVKSRYHWMGEEEIYADMLKDCFDVELSSSEGGDGGICEVCITQLRNAVNFKKQVLHTEEQFKKHVQNKLFKPNIVKVEVTADDGNDSDDNLASEDVYSGPEFEIPIKTEVPEEPKSKKRSAASKATTSRAKKSKTEDGETSTKREQQRVIIDNFKSDESAVLILVQDSKKSESYRKKAREELAKHRQNLKEILLCSNATPILREQGKIGYMCAYCLDEFIEPVQLKFHTREAHANETDPMRNYFKNAILSEYLIRLDITGLRCLLCYVYINTLEELMHHLIDKHNKTIHIDINNHILPFKFNGERLTCCICSNVFDKFKMLQEHMHKHYRNYVCDECDSGYVNRATLTRHKGIHRKGSFPCTYCSKVFNTRLGVGGHIRAVHTHTNLINRCGYCNERFKDHQKKQEHFAKVHGIVNKLIKCTACDRSFATSKKLKAHVKKDHLLERTHKCPQCDMTFFGSYTLSTHMLTHTGVKQYQCDVCFKSYGRKTTLREHMRIHNNDRRFKCEHCAQSFVQKCSWRGHMKSKHGESV